MPAPTRRHAFVRVPALRLALRLAAAFLAAWAMTLARQAEAIPAFARQTGLGCISCHTHPPLLNEFGRMFLRNNFRIPGQEAAAPLAYRKTVPFDIEFPLHWRYDSNIRPTTESKLDAVMLLGGGPLSKDDSYYVHQHILEDNRRGDTYEAWLQHSFPGRGSVNLRIGQFEQPLGFSPEVQRMAHAGFLVYEATVGLDEYAFSSPVRGLLLTAGALGDGTRVAFSVAGARAKEEAHGERTLDEDSGDDVATDRRFGSLFLRVEHQRQGACVGLFGSTGETAVGTATGSGLDRYVRGGIDAELTRGPLRAYGLWTAGTNSNPSATGERGAINGGFVGVEYMLGHPEGMHEHHHHGGNALHLAVYAQYDRAHLFGPDAAGLVEGPTLGIMAHPADWLMLHLEYQRRRDTGNSLILAGHIVL